MTSQNPPTDASGEPFSAQDVVLGMTLAARTVATYGADIELIAQLGLDAGATTAAVLGSAKPPDPYWGKEPHYAIAERCVEVTYRVLIDQFKAAAPVLQATIQALREDLAVVAARGQTQGERTRVGLAELASVLVAVGTLAEVMSYLQARIADWDRSLWHPDRQPASAVERRLRVRTRARKQLTPGRDLSPEDALAGQQMLVVLGGPGSGKSWQARRYARQAAQEALARLASGAALDEVEIPVLTTWDRWINTEGTTWKSLVASSFASGLGHRDPGEGGSADRLQRTFLDPQTRVLLVVDSLDEAAGRDDQEARLYELLGLRAGWRVVVTSRPAAWDAAYSGDPGSPGAPRVVELGDLSYPDDVEGFIRAWFAEDADLTRGQALIEVIRGRADLAQVAVVPLILTFYCLLAEDSNLTAEPLPARRRELYRRLVRRLLRAAWTARPPGLDELADLVDCEALLADWAFSAVRDAVTTAGLGQWGDTFTQPQGRVPPAELRAINHIAPKVTVDGEGTTTRRFVHRTFLEHFLAEHIATLDAGAAADLLLPHLWFDPYWQVTAPAAIVAHNHLHTKGPSCRRSWIGRFIPRRTWPGK